MGNAGEIVTTPVDQCPDANASGRGPQLAASSCGEGTLTAADEGELGKPTIVQTLKAECGSVSWSGFCVPLRARASVSSWAAAL